MRVGDKVSYPAPEGGGRRHGTVEQIKGSRVKVGYGSGSKRAFRWMDAGDLRVVEPA